MSERKKNRPSFFIPYKKCRRSFYVSIARMREKKRKKERKEKKKRKKNLSAGLPEGAKRIKNSQLFCIYIYYAFRFKKKNASTAEHKHNAAIINPGPPPTAFWLAFILLLIFIYVCLYIFLMDREGDRRVFGKTHQVHSPYQSIRWVGVDLNYFRKRKRRFISFVVVIIIK